MTFARRPARRSRSRLRNNFCALSRTDENKQRSDNPTRDHHRETGDEWNGAHPTNVKIAPSGHAFEERRHPEPKNVTAAVTKEQTERQNDHRRMSQRL